MGAVKDEGRGSGVVREVLFETVQVIQVYAVSKADIVVSWDSGNLPYAIFMGKDPPKSRILTSPPK